MADASATQAVTRHPYLCDCSYPGMRSPHVCCSECDDDWDECLCGAPVDPEAEAMLDQMGGYRS